MNSGKLTTLSRPYVSAAFEFALEKNEIEQWTSFLLSASAIVDDPRVSKILSQPMATSAPIETLFAEP
jgi:F-type H+-transporting ATPase subunit delta